MERTWELLGAMLCVALFVLASVRFPLPSEIPRIKTINPSVSPEERRISPYAQEVIRCIEECIRRGINWEEHLPYATTHETNLSGCTFVPVSMLILARLVTGNETYEKWAREIAEAIFTKQVAENGSSWIWNFTSGKPAYRCHLYRASWCFEMPEFCEWLGLRERFEKHMGYVMEHELLRVFNGTGLCVRDNLSKHTMVLASMLARLAVLTGNDTYREYAEKLCRAIYMIRDPKTDIVPFGWRWEDLDKRPIPRLPWVSDATPTGLIDVALVTQDQEMWEMAEILSRSVCKYGINESGCTFHYIYLNGTAKRPEGDPILYHSLLASMSAFSNDPTFFIKASKAFRWRWERGKYVSSTFSKFLAALTGDEGYIKRGREASESFFEEYLEKASEGEINWNSFRWVLSDALAYEVPLLADIKYPLWRTGILRAGNRTSPVPLFALNGVRITLLTHDVVSGHSLVRLSSRKKVSCDVALFAGIPIKAVWVNGTPAEFEEIREGKLPLYVVRNVTAPCSIEVSYYEGKVSVRLEGADARKIENSKVKLVSCTTGRSYGGAVDSRGVVEVTVFEEGSFALYLNGLFAGFVEPGENSVDVCEVDLLVVDRAGKPLGGVLVVNETLRVPLKAGRASLVLPKGRYCLRSEEAGWCWFADVRESGRLVLEADSLGGLYLRVEAPGGVRLLCFVLLVFALSIANRPLLGALLPCCLLLPLFGVDPSYGVLALIAAVMPLSAWKKLWSLLSGEEDFRSVAFFHEKVLMSIAGTITLSFALLYFFGYAVDPTVPLSGVVLQFLLTSAFLAAKGRTKLSLLALLLSPLGLASFFLPIHLSLALACLISFACFSSMIWLY